MDTEVSLKDSHWSDWEQFETQNNDNDGIKLTE